MILIADGGSTKVEWALVEGGQVVKTFETGGVNPIQQSGEEITETLREALNPEKTGAVEAVYYYGAGCKYEEPRRTMEDVLRTLTGAASINVDSDMKGAAIATLGDRRGMVGILGTGANSCCYDGVVIRENISPLGYILGDEGSGADIGKTVLKCVLRGYCGEEMKTKLIRYMRMSEGDIIKKVYSKEGTGAFLALVVGFVKENRESKYMELIVKSRLKEYVGSTLGCYPEEYKRCGVAFVGGIATEFEKELREVCELAGLEVIKVIKRPIEGMAEYHGQKKEANGVHIS